MKGRKMNFKSIFIPAIFLPDFQSSRSNALWKPCRVGSVNPGVRPLNAAKKPGVPGTVGVSNLVGVISVRFCLLFSRS